MDLWITLLVAVTGVAGTTLGAWVAARGQRLTVDRQRQHDRDSHLMDAIVDVQAALMRDVGLMTLFDVEHEDSELPLFEATRRLALWGGDDAADTLADLAFEVAAGAEDQHAASAMFRGWARTATDYVRGSLKTPDQVRQAYQQHGEAWINRHG